MSLRESVCVSTHKITFFRDELCQISIIFLCYKETDLAGGAEKKHYIIYFYLSKTVSKTLEGILTDKLITAILKLLCGYKAFRQLVLKSRY